MAEQQKLGQRKTRVSRTNNKRDILFIKTVVSTINKKLKNIQQTLIHQQTVNKLEIH